MTDTLSALHALQAAGLTSSEAIPIVRGARQLPGPVAANLPFALDVLAAESAHHATRLHRTATLLRQTTRAHSAAFWKGPRQ